MYKRRKKTGLPQASSTLINNPLLLSSSQSSVSTSYSNASISVNSPKKTDESSSISAIDKENVLNPKMSQKLDDLLDIMSSQKRSSQLSQKRVLAEIDSEDIFCEKKKLNFMEETLENAGFVLSNSSGHNLLRKDQAVFVRDVSKALSMSKDKKSIDTFMSELKNYLSNKDNLRNALLPTKTDCELNIARGEFQGCLIRLLLTIEFLQPPIMDFLLNSLGEFIVPEDEAKEECTMWVRMILQQFRFLPKLVQPSEVTQKLFDVVHSTSILSLQHEIISCLPEITGDEQRSDVSRELLDLLKSTPRLTPTILDALSNFCLEGDSLFELQMTLIRSLRVTDLNHIGPYVAFIISSPPPLHLDEIFNGLRSELILCQSGELLSQPPKPEDSDSTLTLIFEKIRNQILLNKKFGEAWFKNIGKVKSHKYHKPIDMLILLILYSVASDPMKKKAIESLFKTKIRSGHFQTSLINETLEVASIVVKTYFNDLLKLLSTMLIVNDVIVSKYFASIYVSCFDKMEVYYRKMIVINLIDNITANIKTSKPVLKVLHYLTENHTSQISPFATRIAHLMDLVSEMKIVEMRELIDILCTIAFNDIEDTSASFQDEIYMIAQKQICCPDPKIFKSGIVCAITTIKHMVNVKEGELNETPVDLESIVLNPQCEKAFNLLDLVLIGTQSSPEAHVLTYDQLSYAVMTCPNMDKSFTKKVSQLMQATLQSNYIVASSSFKKNDDFDTSLEYCLDTDLEDPIALNIVGAVLQEQKKFETCTSKVVTLPGLMRVIRGLELADLSEIDALLGCSVVFPSFTVYPKFGSLEPYFQKIVIDSLFHTCNWFRETVNSFVYLIKEGTPEKILTRIRGIVQLQNLIVNCLPQAIAYTPPQYYFENKKSIAIEKVKRPKTKKSSKNKTVNKEDDETLDETAQVTQVESDEEKEEEIINIDYSILRNHLREFDFDVFLVLTQPLILAPKPSNGSDLSSEFGPSELMLLLDDLNAKLKFCLETKKPLLASKQENMVGFDNISNIQIDLVVRNTTKLTTHLAGQLQKIVGHFHSLQKIHDGIMDAPGMFAPGLAELKKCSALIFSIYNTFFSWPELKADSYIKCLIKSSLKLGDQTVEKGKGITLNYSLQSAILFLKTISKCILDLTSAVNLVTLIDTLRNLQDENEEDYKEIQIDEICEQFLIKKWYDFKGSDVKGTQINQQMSKLLEYYFNDGNLYKINSTLTWLMDEICILDENPTLTTFPHFNKNNLYILISCICKCLVNVTKKGLEGKNNKEQIDIWEVSIKCLQNLVVIVKAQDSKLNLRQFLKGCLPMLKLFLSHGINLFSTMFKLETTSVSQSLKNLQVITRYIQNVLNYSKVSKDNSLIQQLPGLRGLLETILLSVKNMMLQNKCTDAFFMGSMKNKDHHGEVIPSQEIDDTTRDEDVAEPMETDNADSDSERLTNKTDGSLSDAC